MSKRFNLSRLARKMAAGAVTRARRIWKSDEKRDRVKMHLAFALVLGLLVTGTDYVITGGVEWNPGGEAYAMEMPQSRARADLVVRAGPLPPTTEVKDLEWIEIAPIDYSVTTETLLGGPDTVLAAYEPFADGMTRDADKPDALAATLEAQSAKAQPL